MFFGGNGGISGISAGNVNPALHDEQACLDLDLLILTQSNSRTSMTSFAASGDWISQSCSSIVKMSPAFSILMVGGNANSKQEA